MPPPYRLPFLLTERLHGAVALATPTSRNKSHNIQHQFRLGSTSKAISAVAIAALIDDHHLKFSSKIGSLDPSLDESLHDITLEQAMSHYAGIRNYGLCFCFPMWEHQNRKTFSSVRDSVGVIEGSPLLFQPGSSFKYTSQGYNLAGLAAERSVNKSFRKILEEEVFLPLSMKNSRLEVDSEENTNRAAEYEVDNGNYKPVFAVNNSIRWPSGGILSTPTDMLKLGSAMLDDRILSDEVRAKLLTIPEGGRKFGGESYALGWRMSDRKLDNEFTVKSYHHNGVAVGSQSVFVVFPEQNMVISAMMNKNGTNTKELTKIVNQLAIIFMGEN